MSVSIVSSQAMRDCGTEGTGRGTWKGYERSRIEDENKRNIPMEMEWMEPIIPIIYRQLNIRTMGIRDRIGLMSIYSRIE
jgi:hypothetical protein